MPDQLLNSARNTATILVSALLSACTDLALQAINVPSYIAADHQSERGLQYGERGDQKLDIYFPPAKDGERRQLVVFLYGGAWSSGSRGDYYFVAETLTKAGYAVAIPDYIKYPKGTFPTFVTDVAQSIAWLEQNVSQYAEVDEFILMGHSAGAHTAALLLTDMRYLKAVDVDPQLITAFVGLAGPYGFIPKEKKYRDIFDNLEDYNQMRPQYFADGDEPPMLLVHGEADSTVVPSNTERFATLINDNGGRVETRYYAGVGHVAPVLALSRTPLSNADIRTAILDFLDRHAAESAYAADADIIKEGS